MKRKSTISLLILGLAIISVVFPAIAGPVGNWTTDFTLYNLNESQSASVAIMRYSECTGGSCTSDSGTLVTSTTISPDGSFYYNPAADSGFPSSYTGSIIVSSSQPLVGTVTLANDLTGTQYASDAYSAVVSPSTSVYLPIVMAKLGAWNTRITVQNAGTSTANVTIDYVGSGAPGDTTITNLPASMMAMVDQYDLGVSNFNGSAIVTSTEPLAVIVEEYKTTGGVLVTYNGVPSSDADTTVYLPGYIAQGTWATDFTIVNTEGTTANISVAFSGSGNSLSGTIAGNGSGYINGYAGVYPPGWTGTAPTSGYYGSATITSDKNIVVAYNISNSGGGVGNLAMGYVGFPSSGAGTTIVVPLIMNTYSTGWNTTFSVQNIAGGTANLNLYYTGNLSPNCSPCNYSMTSVSHTFNQLADGHVPTGFLGGVKIVSDKSIVVIADQANTAYSSYIGGDSAAGFTGFKK